MANLLSEMRTAHANGELQTISIENINSLTGKRIQTLYFGYDGQDGVDDFTVGEIVKKGDDLTIIADDGRDTGIRYSEKYDFDGLFYCTDVDRAVFFRKVFTSTATMDVILEKLAVYHGLAANLRSGMKECQRCEKCVLCQAYKDSLCPKTNQYAEVMNTLSKLNHNLGEELYRLANK